MTLFYILFAAFLQFYRKHYLFKNMLHYLPTLYLANSVVVFVNMPPKKQAPSTLYNSTNTHGKELNSLLLSAKLVAYTLWYRTSIVVTKTRTMNPHIKKQEPVEIVSFITGYLRLSSSQKNPLWVGWRYSKIKGV